MKKMVSFLLIVSCLCSPFVLDTKSLFSLSEIDDVCFVSNGKIEGSYDVVYSGDKVFSYFTPNEAKKVDLNQKIDAVELFFEDFNLESIKKHLNLQIISEEKYGDINVILGYTTLFKDCVYVEGKKVNVQLAVYDDKLIAGFPMILTGY